MEPPNELPVSDDAEEGQMVPGPAVLLLGRTLLQGRWLPGLQVSAVACGDTHTVLVSSAGQAYGFGVNKKGQLGLGHCQKVTQPTRISGLGGHTCTLAGAGRDHTIVGTVAGLVFAFGGNDSGQLGNGVLADGDGAFEVNPVQVKLKEAPLVQVGCGAEHSAALTESGELWTWGSNEYGQLGQGSSKPAGPTPRRITSKIGKIATVSLGYYHTMVVSAKNGDLYGFGEADEGKLGLQKVLGKVKSPTKISLKGASKKVAIRYLACGRDHSIIVTDDGVKACGMNERGQLGLPLSTTACSEFTSVPFFDDKPPACISAGDTHTAVALESGELVTYGCTDHGRLGHAAVGDLVDAESGTVMGMSPAIVLSLQNVMVVTVGCGGRTTCIIGTLRKENMAPTESLESVRINRQVKLEREDQPTIPESDHDNDKTYHKSSEDPGCDAEDASPYKPVDGESPVSQHDESDDLEDIPGVKMVHVQQTSPDWGHRSIKRGSWRRSRHFSPPLDRAVRHGVPSLANSEDGIENVPNDSWIHKPVLRDLDGDSDDSEEVSLPEHDHSKMHLQELQTSTNNDSQPIAETELVSDPESSEDEKGINAATITSSPPNKPHAGEASPVEISSPLLATHTVENHTGSAVNQSDDENSGEVSETGETVESPSVDANDSAEHSSEENAEENETEAIDDDESDEDGEALSSDKQSDVEVDAANEDQHESEEDGEALSSDKQADEEVDAANEDQHESEEDGEALSSDKQADVEVDAANEDQHESLKSPVELDAATATKNTSRSSKSKKRKTFFHRKKKGKKGENSTVNDTEGDASSVTNMTAAESSDKDTKSENAALENDVSTTGEEETTAPKHRPKKKSRSTPRSNAAEVLSHACDIL